MYHEEYLVRQAIEELRNMMSDQNLELLPDYEQRIGVLKELGFIDEHGNVELKGRVACEVSQLYGPSDIDQFRQRINSNGTHLG